jgi:hypothetical protein
VDPSGIGKTIVGEQNPHSESPSEPRA